MLYADDRAEELEGLVRAVRGGDEAAAQRRLENALKTLKTAYKEVKALSQGAAEAAAKCEVCVRKMYEGGREKGTAGGWTASPKIIRLMLYYLKRKYISHI